MIDLVERLRQTLGGVAREESGGDNLAILLASYFEPGIESEELDDSETWKQGAIDASNRVLDAIHAHYATELAALRERVKELEAERDAAVKREKYAIEWANRSVDSVKEELFPRTETAERELETANANHRAMASQLADMGRKLAEAREDNERYRNVLEIIAGSADKLQALQATAALDNIGPKI